MMKQMQPETLGILRIENKKWRRDDKVDIGHDIAKGKKPEPN